MRKIKIISLFLSLLISANALFAQSVDDGKKFLYYERYNSAKDVLSKLVNSNPNNVDAVYWLGQAYLSQETPDINSAKALYQKAIGTNPNAPLLLVAMGQIALLENNISDARNRFETAISLTKSKDFNVLNAIGRATVYAKAGDVPYAVEKMKMIPENKRTAEQLTTLGDLYRKVTDGANAQQSYQAALVADPNYARASFMIGRIYQTQGLSQEPYYMRYYDEAISKDAKFAPVYSWLSEYYYRRDINKARDYLDKYIANADPDTKNCYYQASFLYASSKNQEAISKANECIASAGATPYPKLYGIKAYAYDKLNDSVNAKQSFQDLFSKLPADQLGPNDYATYSRVLLKFPGNETMASDYINKALALDTLESDKIEHINSIATVYLNAKNYNEAAMWYSRLLSVKKNPTKTDIYNTGINYYRAANYKSADSAFVLYQQKYPTDMLGFYYGAISNANIDSTSALGLALPDYLKVIELAQQSTDSARAKQQMVTGYNYLINYYYNVKKDKDSAILYNDKILLVDPTNAQALENKKALTQAPVKTKVKDDKEKTKTDDTKTKVKDDKEKTKTDDTKTKIIPGKTKTKGK